MLSLVCLPAIYRWNVETCCIRWDPLPDSNKSKQVPFSQQLSPKALELYTGKDVSALKKSRVK